MDQTTALEPAGAAAGGLDAGVVREFVASMQALSSDLDDAGRIDLIRSLEVLKCATEGAMAAVSADFDASQRSRAAERGTPHERQGRGIAAQVALARRESPHKGERHLGLAKVLATEMPDTLAALRRGHISEWKATLLARETACLSRDDRRLIDAELCADPTVAEGMGDHELAATARKRACELDPASVAARRSKAEKDRHVSIRPAPDTMVWLTGQLPVKQGVAVWAVLKGVADRTVVAGDQRSRGQIMADTLVARVLGSDAVTDEQPEPPVTVNVVIDAEALLCESESPGHVPDYGPIPAETVREWVEAGLAAGVLTELRRLFADPNRGQLLAMESKARSFPKGLAAFIEFRDQRCRTPWCDAPVRHVDHVTAAADGGATSVANGQGLCEACNYAKEAIGWEAHPRPGPTHTVETVTPTGHRYLSTAPPALTPRETRDHRYQIDFAWAS